MAETVYLYPIGDDQNNFNLTGEATAFECVDDTQGASDDAATMIHIEAVQACVCINTVTAPPGDMGSITSVTLYHVSYTEVGGTVPVWTYMRIGGSDYHGINSTASGTWDTINSGAKAVNPDTGVSWSPSDIANLRIKDTCAGEGGRTVRLSSTYYKVIYEKFAGGSSGFLVA